jgi:hypothetical protein
MRPYSVPQQQTGSVATTWPSLSKVSLKQLWQRPGLSDLVFGFPSNLNHGNAWNAQEWNEYHISVFITLYFHFGAKTKNSLFSGNLSG